MNEFSFSIPIKYLEEDSWLPRLFPINNSTKNNQKIALFAVRILELMVYNTRWQGCLHAVEGTYFFKFIYENIEHFHLI